MGILRKSSFDCATGNVSCSQKKSTLRSSRKGTEIVMKGQNFVPKLVPNYKKKGMLVKVLSRHFRTKKIEQIGFHLMLVEFHSKLQGSNEIS